MRAGQTMRIICMLLSGFGLGSFSWGMVPQDVLTETGVATVSETAGSGVPPEPAMSGADRRSECAVSPRAYNEQALFLVRLVRDNKAQKNVRFIDFSDEIYAKRALQYKFYTRDLQDLLNEEGVPAGAAATVILSILVPLYQHEYEQEKKENELFHEYLLRSSGERFNELEGLVKEAKLFEKLDTLYVPLCDAIIADQAATENERRGEC